MLVGRTQEQGTGQAIDVDAGARPAASAAGTLRVVIAHDFLECFGGAERVTEQMATAFPDASVHAILARDSVLERMGIADRFEGVLPAWEPLLRHYRKTAPLLPAIVDRVRLPEADVLLTSSYAFANRFRTVNDAPQVCYCHSPLRFAWSMTDTYRGHHARGALAGHAFNAFAAGMRHIDRRAAARVHSFLTGSQHQADQIRRFYGRDAEVIGAPVDTDRFRLPEEDAPPGDYFLFCGRLVEPYKKAGITIEAFRRLGLRLIIVGDGPDMPDLRAAAPPNVEFAGVLEDDEIVKLMQGCSAALFPSHDDFGLTPLEVMSCGRPVLAYSQGGARYTMRPGVTGEFFHQQTPAAIEEAVRAFDPASYDPRQIRTVALNWSAGAFRRRLVELVSQAAVA